MLSTDVGGVDWEPKTVHDFVYERQYPSMIRANPKPVTPRLFQTEKSKSTAKKSSQAASSSNRPPSISGSSHKRRRVTTAPSSRSPTVAANPNAAATHNISQGDRAVMEVIGGPVEVHIDSNLAQSIIDKLGDILVENKQDMVEWDRNCLDDSATHRKLHTKLQKPCLKQEAAVTHVVRSMLENINLVSRSPKLVRAEFLNKGGQYVGATDTTWCQADFFADNGVAIDFKGNLKSLADAVRILDDLMPGTLEIVDDVAVFRLPPDANEKGFDGQSASCILQAVTQMHTLGAGLALLTDYDYFVVLRLDSLTRVSISKPILCSKAGRDQGKSVFPLLLALLFQTPYPADDPRFAPQVKVAEALKGIQAADKALKARQQQTGEQNNQTAGQESSESGVQGDKGKGKETDASGNMCTKDTDDVSCLTESRTEGNSDQGGMTNREIDSSFIDKSLFRTARYQSIKVSAHPKLVSTYEQNAQFAGSHWLPLNCLAQYRFELVETVNHIQQSGRIFSPTPPHSPLGGEIEFVEYLSSGAIWDCWIGTLRGAAKDPIKVAIKICRPATFDILPEHIRPGAEAKDEYKLTCQQVVSKITKDGNFADRLSRVQPPIVPSFYGLFYGQCKDLEGKGADLFMEILEYVGPSIAESQKATYSEEIEKAYRVLHEQGVLHYDLAARHIRLYKDEKLQKISIRLIDFDQAELLREEDVWKLDEEMKDVQGWLAETGVKD